VPDPVVSRADEVLDRLREEEAIEARGGDGGDTEPTQAVFDLSAGEFTTGGADAPDDGTAGDATAGKPSLALPSAVTTGDLPSGEVTLRPEGRVTLLNFFATWCAPCEEEMPALRRLRAAYDESTLHVVSITPQVETAVVESFWEEHDATWPAVTDRSLEASQRWNATSYPTNVLFDRDGTLVEYVRGREFEAFDDAVAQLVDDG